MGLVIDVVKFLWFMRLASSRKRWRHAKNYNMYWRYFVSNYSDMTTKRLKEINHANINC